MTDYRIKHRPSRRQQVGNAVLHAASVVETRAVAKRLAAFTEAHAVYEEAQTAVDAAQAQRRDVRRNMADSSTALEHAIDELAFALVVDRRPRMNPFSAYDVPSPSALKESSLADRLRAAPAVVAAVVADETLSDSSHKAAEALGLQVDALAAATEPLASAEVTLRTARLTRDRVGREWDRALHNLKRDVRIAADEGAEDLYELLFGGLDKRGSSGVTPSGVTPSGSAEDAPSPTLAAPVEAGEPEASDTPGREVDAA